MLTSNTKTLKHYTLALRLRPSKATSSRQARVTASHAVNINTKKACEYRWVELEYDDSAKIAPNRANHASSLKKKKRLRSDVQLSNNIKQAAYTK